MFDDVPIYLDDQFNAEVDLPFSLSGDGKYTFAYWPRVGAIIRLKLRGDADFRAYKVLANTGRRLNVTAYAEA